MPESNPSSSTPIDHVDKRLLPPGERELREKFLVDTFGFSQEKIDKIKSWRSELFSVEVINSHINGLKERGFINPHKMIETWPSILDLSFSNLDGKISGLKERGFTNPHKMIETSPTTLGLGFDNIDSKISGLKERGFTNPHKMIETSPTTLGLGFDNIDSKISGLKERGFTNPHKMIETMPTVLGLGFSNIDAKISGLKERGFNNPHRMIESMPTTLGFGFDNIDSKISGLKERGFNNPHRMIESLPQILGYGFENIDAKISGLKERGFNNPHRMIESLPQILGYGFENIDTKIELLSRLNNLYGLNLDPISVIESNLTILGRKFEKLIVIARVLRDYQPSPGDVQRKISNLNAINLESLLISYSQKDSGDTIDDLVRIAKEIQKQKLSKEEKRQSIKNFFKNHPESHKIYREYLKGYPDKELSN